MISSFKKLWRDTSGNALVLVGASLPLVVGCAGLASDTIQWALWKRQLQRTADSAALAGVYAIKDGKSYSTAATNDISVNNQTGMTLQTPVITQPTVTGYTSAVRVSLSVQKQLPFSSMFLTAAPTVTVEATAAVSKEGSYCVKALNNTTSPSIIINGNITLDTGCGIISNSVSTTEAISVSGNAHIVNADPIAGAGAVPSINGSNTEMSYQLPQSDPYAGKYSTDVPAGMSCSTLSSRLTSSTPTVTSSGKTYQVINPGCYTRQGNGNNAANQAFSPSGQNLALNPGTYYINNADFDIGALTNITVNPSAATNLGVTIILTGTTPGKVNISSNSEVKLRAPSDGSTYDKMLFIQKAGATASSLISGNSTSSFDGTFYFPSTTVDYNGGAASVFKCAMMVGWVVSFSGNSAVQNNTTGCYANQTDTVERVRLIG